MTPAKRRQHRHHLAADPGGQRPTAAATATATATGMGTGMGTATRALRAWQRRRRRQQAARLVLTVLGYLLTAAGLVVGLALAYQLWGTNLTAARTQAMAIQQLQASWLRQHQEHQDHQDRGIQPPTLPAPPLQGTPFAIIALPRLHTLGEPSLFPIVEGDGPAQLDRGAVGHEPGTAMPGQVGNVVLAGHRNSHGEPFRHLDQLQQGDRILVATADRRHRRFISVYVLDKQLAQTTPSDIGVMAPIPTKLGVTRPGRYLTLITCTPQFSTKYRMIWWGHLEETIWWPFADELPQDL